jgi:hypothetical protein
MAKTTFYAICFLLASCSISNAQVGRFSKDTIILVGKMKIAANEKYDYKIKFSINPTTYEIVGLSLSDYNGPNETKAKIIGKYNPKKDEIEFHETEVVKSKATIKSSEFCYINATLKFKKNKLLQVYSGKFVGRKLNSKIECGTGEIDLMDVAKSKLLLEKIIKKNAEVEAAKAAAKEEKEIKKKLIVYAEGDAPALFITGNSVKLTVWDKGQIDGDKISILVNEKTVLSNYVLDSTRKILDIPLSKAGEDVVTIVAHNEGTVPPNTAMIKIESATEMYPIEVRADVNESKKIFLKKRK